MSIYNPKNVYVIQEHISLEFEESMNEATIDQPLENYFIISILNSRAGNLFNKNATSYCILTSKEELHALQFYDLARVWKELVRKKDIIMPIILIDLETESIYRNF